MDEEEKKKTQQQNQSKNTRTQEHKNTGTQECLGVASEVAIMYYIHNSHMDMFGCRLCITLWQRPREGEITQKKEGHKTGTTKTRNRKRERREKNNQRYGNYETG